GRRRRRRERGAPQGRGAAPPGRGRRRGRDAVSAEHNGHGPALLRAERLIKSYAGRRVVNEVSIEVRAGEVVCLLGPNGAGKTTTFYMIVGLTRPDTGQVYLNGEDLTRLPMYERARRGLSYLPQEPSV